MNELKDELKLCNTLNEIFEVLDEHYDLDEYLGPIARSILVNSIPNIIIVTGAKKKQQEEIQP